MIFMGDYTAEFGRGPDKRPRRRRMARNLAIAGAGVVGTGVAARYGMKRGGKAIGSAIESASREASRRASKGAVAGAAMGASQGAGQAVAIAAKRVPTYVARVASTPANTRKAFEEGLKTEPSKDSALLRVARRAGRDAGKTRRWIKKTTGFSRYPL